ncbi:MAG: NlpC/P60 family protein [Pseudomonadota bacterium]
MMDDFDPRVTPFNGRVADISLKGKVDAERFVEPVPYQLDWHHGAILTAPGGPRTRELLPGEVFLVLDMPENTACGDAFGYAARDGYVGYIAARALQPAAKVTHMVVARESYRKATPDLKAHERTFRMSFGHRVNVTGVAGDWSEISLRPVMGDPDQTSTFFVPKAHLRPVDAPFPDPVTIAELFLHTPYLWGGNTAFGIDCSGLIQAALLACGTPCPGDSDQQEARVGTLLDPAEPLRRGDLIFWKGHVGMMRDAETLIHANAHHMAVASEPFGVATARIAASGGGPITSRRRI